jgi:nitroreductase
MHNNQPVIEIIKKRYSCRAYQEKPIEEKTRQRLEEFLSALRAGPLGSAARFALAAATEQDRNSLRGLGTYGFIKGATGFMVGAARPGEKNLEDYGYLMERAILYATAIGLGTCWLGGSFTKSNFAKKISATQEEIVPAVTATGYLAEGGSARDAIRLRIGGDRRLAWENLFFQESFGAPLAPEAAGDYATPLEMVRLGPSASNKQPWRIIRAGQAWHFYLQRTPGYREGFLQRLMKVNDIQRVDMGIAMCHFELTAREQGLNGAWVVAEPNLARPDALTEYTASWVS